MRHIMSPLRNFTSYSAAMHSKVVDEACPAKLRPEHEQVVTVYGP